VTRMVACPSYLCYFGRLEADLPVVRGRLLAGCFCSIIRYVLRVGWRRGWGGHFSVKLGVKGLGCDGFCQLEERGRDVDDELRGTGDTHGCLAGFGTSEPSGGRFTVSVRS
jgi:hypothetical protein